MGKQEHFITKLDFKIAMVFFSIFVFICMLGSIPEEPIKGEPWVKSDRGHSTQSINRKRTQYRVNDYNKPAWENDKKEKTQEWEDFIEELDNRGYDLWDPEAEDIWETYK